MASSVRELGACRIAESFTTTNRYLDNKHHPRGLSRRGDFTIKEVQLLEYYGYAFNELDLGRRELATEEEKLFATVCHGERESVTEAERVWFKYMTHIKRPKRFRTLSGGEPQVEGAEDYTDSNDR